MNKLPEHEIIVHMDFAENYSCKSAEEVTDAYFTTSQVFSAPKSYILQTCGWASSS